MNLDRDPIAIAQAAANEIRAFNQRTIDTQAFEQPADVYRATDALLELVQHMPKAIEQAWKRLREMEQDDAIRMDNSADVHEAMEKVRMHLNEARRDLGYSWGHLNNAVQTMSHMGGQW